MKEFIKILLITLFAFIILYFVISFVNTPDMEGKLIHDLKNYKRDNLTGVVVVDDSIPSFSDKTLHIWLVERQNGPEAIERLVRSVTIDNFSHEVGKEEATDFNISEVFDEKMDYYLVTVVADSNGREEIVLVGRCTHQDSCLVLTKDNPHTVTARLMPAGPIRTVDPSVRCNLNPHPGRCRASIPRYYFDKNTSECEEFLWGGCQGVVPFETIEDCVTACE